MKRFLIVFVAVVNLVLADAVTKELAEHLLKLGESFAVIPGFFDLALVHNRGCAWGMFQGQVWPLAAFGLLALGLLVWQRKKMFEGLAGAIAEPVLYAGIVGNVIDRLYRGYVIDMFDFHWHDAYHYPCFNVADICICVAAGILILASFRKKK